jgi:hypothetical protein
MQIEERGCKANEFRMKKGINEKERKKQNEKKT